MPDALVIPAAAVRTLGTKASALVIENGRAVRRAVELGVADAANSVVQVKSGVSAGTMVIVTAGAAITDGARVQVTNSKSAGKD